MLICNAGIMELPTLEQVNGIEKQFFVNHLGHFVLVNRLLDQVIHAPQGRIVNVSSGAAIRSAPESGIEFDNLSGERDYQPDKAYGQSKLANVLFTLELARRLDKTDATANALRPGVIPTNLGRHMPSMENMGARNARQAVHENNPARRRDNLLCRDKPGFIWETRTDTSSTTATRTGRAGIQKTPTWPPGSGRFPKN